MSFRNIMLPALLAAALCSVACTQTQKPAAEQPQMKLPPGWTEQDMKAMMEAGTPGEMHAYLKSAVGTWKGQDTMWMGPDTEPVKSQSKAKISSIMGGRFTKIETTGYTPGMGKFEGFGIYGYDNVAHQFVSTWTDNMSTGITNGTGVLSPDHNVLTWNYTFNCPINKKPTVLRQVETVTGKDTKILEMWTTEPKSGKEYKCMHIEMTRGN